MLCRSTGSKREGLFPHGPSSHICIRVGAKGQSPEKKLATRWAHRGEWPWHRRLVGMECDEDRRFALLSFSRAGGAKEKAKRRCSPHCNQGMSSVLRTQAGS